MSHTNCALVGALVGVVLAIVLTGCSTIETACDEHPTACAVAGAVAAGCVAATIAAHHHGAPEAHLCDNSTCVHGLIR
jgi:hypothetical protein